MKNADIIFGLVAYACGNDVPQLPERVDWRAVIDLATMQGVDVIAADGLQKLVNSDVSCPALEQLSAQEDLAMNWIGQGFVSEIRHSSYMKAVGTLVRTFADDGLETILLKGCSLNRYWPIPEHRPLGDVDFYLFRGSVVSNEAGRGDELLRRLGLNPVPGVKHSSSTMQGVPLENHSTFLNEDRDRTGECLNRAILESVADVAALGRTPVSDAAAPGPASAEAPATPAYRTLPPTANCLFLLRHLAKHFLSYESVIIRQVLDVALFLNGERGNIDLHSLKLTLRAVGMDRIADVFFCIAETVSGFSFSEFRCGDVDQKVVRKVLDEILRPKEQLPSNCCGVKRVARRARNFVAGLWKYSLVPDNVLSHLLHPSILSE